MNRLKYGITVATCVCCSITSEIHTRYARARMLPRQILAAVSVEPREHAGRRMWSFDQGDFGGG